MQGIAKLSPVVAVVLGRFDPLGRPRAAIAIGLMMVALVALSDWWTGYEIRLAILYLLPISLVTWVAGRTSGSAVAVTSAATWLAMFQGNHPYSDELHFYWEAAVLAGMFLVVVTILARLREVLERSDERFVTVLEEIDAAVCVERTSAEEVIFCNRSYHDTFGARTLAEANLMRGQVGEIQVAGHRRWYLVREHEIRWLDGKPARLRILADITELKQAAESLRRHREASERSARLVALGELGSSLAHELNQPLAAIATYLDSCALQLEAAGVTGEPLEAIAKCRAQSTRAGAIIQRLREFLRQRRAVSEPADVHEMIRRALELVEEEARELGVQLRVALAPGLPRVAADALLVEQVLLNLMRNGFDAMRQVPAALRELAVDAAESRGLVTVTVSDRGAGIDSTAAERLFDPFFTTKDGGLGLGLGICRSIIEAHGGRLWHARAEGGATAFHFTLPPVRA